MAETTQISATQMIVTLEDNAMVAEIKKALKLIRGIASVRVAHIDDDGSITPALRRSIKKAREEFAKGETISCRTPEEMQKYFDSPDFGDASPCSHVRQLANSGNFGYARQ